LFKQYEYAISLLEKMTDGLVIDQDHNCGGSVDFMHDLASLLTTKPFTPIQFHLLANKSEYLSFKKWLDELSPFTLEHQQAKFLTEKIKKHWMQGDELTDLLSINGQSVYFPHHQTRYTKPIVVLIDQMAGSGGDAFPALLQGIGRAKLFGTTTMGAGGHVEDQPALPFSGLATSMTKSLFYRPDGVPVENQGAVPDRVYQITTYDFVNGYQAYQEAYTQYLEEFLP
jgi:C-terminal processing protease CtpA/Prc